MSDNGAPTFRSSYAKLPAQDVRRARTIYCDKLGLEPVRHNDADHLRGAAGLHVQGLRHGLRDGPRRLVQGQ